MRYMIAVILMCKYSSHINMTYIFRILYLIPLYSVSIFGIVIIVISKLEKILCFFQWENMLRLLRKIPKLRIAWNYAETAFPQNLHTRKLGEIIAFYAVKENT